MVVKDEKKEMDTVLANPYEKPPKISTKESIRNFIYNPSTKAVMGRTASSWAKIGLFYLIFYGVLAVLVGICYFGFSQTLDPRIPRWQLEKSIIGTNPGLGFRPMPPSSNVESTLIWFKGSDEKNWGYWVQQLKDFMDHYKKPGSIPGQGANVKICHYDDLPNRGEVCYYDHKSWQECTEEKFFGFYKSSPCIFLKLNKIYGWKPEFYNDTNSLPEKMPQQLKDSIKAIGRKSPPALNTVWVSCEGENPADEENIGPIAYYPQPGFPGYYYPYENSEGYLSPLVAVQFKRPRTGILINIECKAWAKNIKYHRNDKLGSVHFELLID